MDEKQKGIRNNIILWSTISVVILSIGYIFVSEMISDVKQSKEVKKELVEVKVESAKVKVDELEEEINYAGEEMSKAEQEEARKQAQDREAEKRAREAEKQVEQQVYITKMDRRANNLISEGSIHSIDIERNEVRVSPSIWLLLNLEQKQTLVLFFNLYFEVKGSTGRVSILSDRNDTKFASYSVWSGVKIYY